MTHIRGHLRDGKWIQDHEDKRPAAQGKPGPKNLFPVQHSLFGAGELPEGAAPAKAKKPAKGHQGAWWGKGGGEPYAKPSEPQAPPAGAKPHPMADEEGHQVLIHYPSKPSPAETWDDPAAVAVFTPDSPAPEQINGVPLAQWEDHPTTPEGWAMVDGQDGSLLEPPLPEHPGKALSAGVIVEEPDGRLWVISPTNQYGGYKRTFPKGRLEEGIGPQASAIKEAFEETGLKVEITGFVADVERSTTVTRYYTARRVGGTPTEMGWESQSVAMVPRSKLYAALNKPVDWPLAEAMGAGPRPDAAT